MTTPTATTLAPWYVRRFLALDFESTGTDPKTCRAVSAALAIVKVDGTLASSWYQLIKQAEPIPEGATQIHGITTEQANANGVEPADVVQRIASAIEWAQPRGVPIVMFNATYDWGLLHAEAERAGLTIPRAPILDPRVFDLKLWKYRKGSRKLGDVARDYSIDVAAVASELSLHDARKDAVLAALIMRRIPLQFPEVRDFSLEDLQAHQAAWYFEWREGINAHWKATGQDKRAEGDWPR